MSPWLYLTLLAALVAVGPVLVARTIEHLDERTARKAERIITTPTLAKQARLVAASRAALSPEPADDTWADLLGDGPYVPEQRRPGSGS